MRIRLDGGWQVEAEVSTLGENGEAALTITSDSLSSLQIATVLSCLTGSWKYPSNHLRQPQLTEDCHSPQLSHR